jgi:hypothetical protein
VTSISPPERKTAPRRLRRPAWSWWQLPSRLGQIWPALWYPEPTSLPRERVTLRAVLVRQLLPIVLYLLIAAIMTYPLVLHLTTRVPSDGGDALQNLWDYWWAWRALRAGQNPYFTPLLYAPYGAPLYLHTLNLFNGIISIPFQLLFGMVVAYNAVVFISLALAAYFAYLLVAHVSGNRWAGFAGGVIFAFGSYNMTHLLGHTNLIASEWLPAYALCLLRAIEERRRRRTLFVLGAIGALVLLMLVDWQYVIDAVILTGVFALWYSATRRSLAPIGVAAAIGVIWAICALPLVIPTVHEIRQGITDIPGPNVARTYSADVLSFVVPSTFHTVLKRWSVGWSQRLSAPPVEGGVYLGLLPIALGLLGLGTARRRAGVWALVGLVFLVLALGPVLHIHGRWRFGNAGWTVPLPYQWLQRLPVLNVARTPIRMTLMVTLALAVLAGLGLVRLAVRWPQLRAPRVRPVLLAILTCALIAEHVVIPYQLEAVAPPKFFQELARSPEQGTILEWPFSLKRAQSEYYQTVHGRPIVGGYISRRLLYHVRALPPVGGMPQPGDDIFTQQIDPYIGRWMLQYCDIHWIVVYPNDPILDKQQLPDFLRMYAQPEPIYQDSEMIVYRPLPPGPPAAALTIGPGWYDVEKVPDPRGKIRWFDDSATILAWSFSDQPRQFALRFDAVSFHNPRRLEVLVDGRSVGQWRVVETQRFDIPLTLTLGKHEVTLRALDSPLSPVAAGMDGADTRPLAFAISDAHLDVK